MVVNPTNFVATNIVGNGNVVASEAQVMENVAKNLGFVNVESFEIAQARGSISEGEMQVHENNALLAASGDAYPYNAQFNPETAFDNMGLHLDVNGAERFETFFVDDFVDYSDFNMYAM